MNQDQPQREEEIDVPDISARDQVAQVLDDVRALVQAELGYYRSRLDYSRHVIRWSWRFAAISAFAFAGAVIALVIGLVLTLQRYVGPGLATLVVTVAFASIGAGFGLYARRWIRRIYFTEIDGRDDGVS